MNNPSNYIKYKSWNENRIAKARAKDSVRKAYRNNKSDMNLYWDFIQPTMDEHKLKRDDLSFIDFSKYEKH